MTDRTEQQWSLNLSPLTKEIDSIRHVINRLKSTEARKDLSRLHRNIEDLKSDMSKEAVRCRGFNRSTGTMQTLEKQVEEALSLLNKMLSMALLMD